ncbi:hypothetical protein P7K49_015262 [Saguinus oedipus]|uniref:Centrosomal protein CEP104 N-terminal domain-containing protein n=1 Tax=Saguinus oedipus TaxID=9490 RepID=A0ABQ9V8R3_SAGOE|nr:hypothetical protein P7K49_015262 [Saguinus oedipus]
MKQESSRSGQTAPLSPTELGLPARERPDTAQAVTDTLSVQAALTGSSLWLEGKRSTATGAAQRSRPLLPDSPSQACRRKTKGGQPEAQSANGRTGRSVTTAHRKCRTSTSELRAWIDAVPEEAFHGEIVLQMVERCRIRKLQLLAHQYMISSKIEFYISESLPEYFAPYQAERFRRLGYVSLCDNEKTGCKARELKSVYVDAVGQFLKLIFHQNHVNKYNIYNQDLFGETAELSELWCSLIQRPLGTPQVFTTLPAPSKRSASTQQIKSLDQASVLDERKADVLLPKASREKLIDHYLGHNSEDPALEGSYARKSDYISPLDDLAFDMYQDPEVAQIIRKLDERKREAVQKERYDYAKKLKQAIADLQKVGECLGRYEVEKRCAVEKEDYDLAKEKKQQMEQYRAEVYEQLELHSLLDAELNRAGGCRSPDGGGKPRTELERAGARTGGGKCRTELEGAGARTVEESVEQSWRVQEPGRVEENLEQSWWVQEPGRVEGSVEQSWSVQEPGRWRRASENCVFIQVRRPLDLPLQPLTQSPRHQKPVPSLPQLEEKGTESQFAETFLQEKPSSYSLTISPQHSAVDQLLPATDPHPKINAESLPYDERPLPAIRKHHGEAVVELEMSDANISSARRGGMSGEPEPLTEKALREASSAIDVLGETLVAGAYSKTWSYREDALLALYKKLMEIPVGTPKEDLKNTLRASIFLVRRAIKDIVTSLALAPQSMDEIMRHTTEDQSSLGDDQLVADMVTSSNPVESLRNEVL